MSADSGRDLREAANGPLAARLSTRYLDEHCVLPLGIDADGALATAVGGPLDPTVSDELVRLFGRRLRVIEMPAGEIQAATLSAQREADAASGDGLVTPNAPNGDEGDALDDLRALASQAPVIKLVNVMLLDALRARASDVHVESTASGLRVRFRLDGVLQDISRLARPYQPAVISRIKIMAGLNIAERRLPQDGRARLRLADREIDLRVSTLPALHGESVVLRILDRADAAHELADLGMPDVVREDCERLMRRTSGIVLVTGPTGSGKTTTLYGALARVNRPGVKIVTVEDPIEYQIDGVTQIPVQRKAGLAFATALRSILRHDPDVIMVGEMRDRETAEIAIQAALTGHLVFSTLHTNDAPGGITRLIDMGIEPYLVAATVQAILAQRLVRIVCERCRSAAGCDACSHTGFRGRTGIFELLSLTDELRALVVARVPVDEIRAAARRAGMNDLYADGMRKVEAGLTTVDEVLRVTSAETQP
ncbi:MAG: type II/IV secretion system protein [Gemmatimonadetes bacterium]|nr:type II/IV secretion system protein [Gemmatimonadota bacterium]